ncbi:MAG: septum formation protein Maf [Acidobacteriaceae bacterium]|nr:septum formation protein Maf [Acidobacteriaceae bacterium]
MLILASGSPRRHDLLRAAGIEHVVKAAAISEERKPGENPLDLVQRLAREKGRAIARGPSDIVLAADTEVCIGNEVFGKPSDEEDARRMLRLLSGRDHWVHTGICIVSARREIADVSSTRVRFVDLTEDEITEYTRSGEPLGKSGGYGIQGPASNFVRSIEGCYFNIVGLPVSLVYQHLKSL